MKFVLSFIAVATMFVSFGGLSEVLASHTAQTSKNGAWQTKYKTIPKPGIYGPRDSVISKTKVEKSSKKIAKSNKKSGPAKLKVKPKKSAPLKISSKRTKSSAVKPVEKPESKAATSPAQVPTPTDSDASGTTIPKTETSAPTTPLTTPAPVIDDEETKVAEPEKATSTKPTENSEPVNEAPLVPVIVPETPAQETKTSATTPVTTLPAVKGEVKWFCDFEGSYCGMHEQSKVASQGGRRSTFVSTARSGSQSVKLTTLPGDSGVNGSGNWERNDLQLNPSAEYCNAGQEEWWAMSIFFPNEYVVPNSGGVVMDFHHKASGGQANFHFNSQPYGLQMRGYYGDVKDPDQYRVDLGPVERNKWYDLVYHVKWSENGDGFFTAWMNGKKVLDHKGPTLYKGIPCYLKLANYHDAFGKSSSIIFDRVIRGTSANAVALTPLE